MPFNGSGTFTPATTPSPAYPAVSGTTIYAAQFNTVVVDITTGLTNTLTRDGQSSPTADLPMGTQKHTGVGNATARTHYASAGQVQDGKFAVLSSVAGVDTITATAGFSMAAYATGQGFEFVAAGANTGAATLNLNSIGAKSITKQGTTALVAGDIASGMVCRVVYDGTQFQLLNPVKQAGYQPLDGELTALAGLTSAANKVPMFSGSGTATLLDFKDEDNMASDSATAVASQQSVKAYVDTADALKAPLASPTFTGTPAAPTAAAATNTTQLATTAFVQQELTASRLSNFTATVSTNGTTEKAITGIPSWARKITLGWSAISLGGGAADIRLDLGDAGGYETGNVIYASSAIGASLSGSFTLVNISGNTWAFGDNINGYSQTITQTLDRLRFFSTSNFDAGTLTAYWE